MTEKMFWENRRKNWSTLRKQVPKRFCTLETNPLPRKSKDKCSCCIIKTVSRKEKFCILVIKSFSTMLHFAISFFLGGGGAEILSSIQMPVYNINYKHYLQEKLECLKVFFKKNRRIFFVFKTLANFSHTECKKSYSFPGSLSPQSHHRLDIY